MKILVTGANGMLAKEVKEKFEKGNEIVALAPSIASFNITESLGWPYKTQGITLDRWYGVPVTLESNVEQLHKEAFEQSDYVVSDSIKEISNRIVKKTGYK